MSAKPGDARAIPSGPEAQKHASNETSPVIRAQLEGLMHSLGISEFEPTVADMLVDVVYTYTTDVLRDALAYGRAADSGATASVSASGHGAADAGAGPTVGLKDVELAIRARTDSSLANAVPLQTLLEQARKLNSQPLPQPTNRPGLPLPGSQALTGDNAQYAAEPSLAFEDYPGLPRALGTSDGPCSPPPPPSAALGLHQHLQEPGAGPAGSPAVTLLGLGEATDHGVPALPGVSSRVSPAPLAPAGVAEDEDEDMTLLPPPA